MRTGISAVAEPDVLGMHPVVELITRYRAVFMAAWQNRNDILGGPQYMADELAFLPATISLQETPPHPAPRRAAAVMGAIFFVALIWSCIGKVDIVAVAHGKIVVSQKTKIVQPLEASVVRAIHVNDGDKVHAGQLLIELDATAPDADIARFDQERSNALSEKIRTESLISHLQQHSNTSAPSLSAARLSKQDTDSAKSQLLSEWQDIEAKREKLHADSAHREAEIATVKNEIDKIQTTLPLARQREQDYLNLSKQGYVAEHAGQDKTRERVEMEKDIATAQARLKEAQVALSEAHKAENSFASETLRTLRERQAQAELKLIEAQEEGKKAGQRRALTKLVAPVDGTVQQLAIHTTGGVVTPAQTLLVVVPDHADVTAEVQLENKDIGFVKVGQYAEVKLDAFPYTDYGTVPASITVIAADAVTRDAQSAAQSAQAQEGKNGVADAAQTNAATVYFPITLKLGKTTIEVDGKQTSISPGLALSAEIKIGQRRVIDYLLSPVKRHFSESMHEK